MHLNLMTNMFHNLFRGAKFSGLCVNAFDSVGFTITLALIPTRKGNETVYLLQCALHVFLKKEIFISDTAGENPEAVVYAGRIIRGGVPQKCVTQMTRYWTISTNFIDQEWTM